MCLVIENINLEGIIITNDWSFEFTSRIIIWNLRIDLES